MNTGKVTISLPKSDIIKISNYENLFKVSRSGIFKQAVELWLKVVETKKAEVQYKKVYSDKKVVAADKKTAEELLSLALEIWPKY